MSKITQTTGGVLVTAGGTGGGVAVYIGSKESIGYRLKIVEDRFIFGEKETENIDQAWKDQVSAYSKQYPSGHSDYIGYLGSSEDVVLALELPEICKTILQRIFWKDTDETYLFARRFCSVKETIEESLGDRRSKLSTGDWSKVAQKYQHWPDREDKFGDFDYLFFNSQYNMDPSKIEKFCKDRLGFFHVEGSKFLDLFNTLCLKPMKISEFFDQNVVFLKRDSSDDDSDWQKKIQEYKSKYPGKKPINNFEVPVDVGKTSIVISIDEFKHYCKNSLEEEILPNTWLQFVSETKKWCTK